MRAFSSLFLLTLFGLLLQRQQTCLASNNAVFEGVQNDDNAAIRSAVESDPLSLENVGPGGQTPLIHAVLTGKQEGVKLLLSLGADTSATEKDGYDVLHAAGFQGRSEILQVLLQHFAEQKDVGGFALDPATDKHRDGFYPIHRACWGRHARHTQTVKIFLLNGVSPILSADNGKTCEEMTHNDGTKALISKMQEGSNHEL